MTHTPESPNIDPKVNPVRSLILLAVEGRYKKAIESAEALLAAKPGHAQVMAWLGYCLIETGKKEQGYALIEQTIDANIRSEKPRISYLRSLINDRSEDVLRVHDLLSRRMVSMARNYVTVNGSDPLSLAYAAERAKGAASGEAIPPLLVFNHLPFTGGTSVQLALAQAYQKSTFFNVKRRAGLIKLQKFNELSKSEIARLRYIHLHHPYPLDTRGIPVARITVMRDPVAYFLSGYYKRRNLGKKIIASRDILIENCDLATSVEFARKQGLHNGLARQLAVLHPDFSKAYARHYRPHRTLLDKIKGKPQRTPHLDYLKYEEELFYGKATAKLSESDLYDLAVDILDNSFCQPSVIKHLEAGFLASMAKLGHAVAPRMPHRGASHRPPRESIDQSVKTRLAELNQIDQRLYDRSVEAFERDHPELIAAVKSAPEHYQSGRSASSASGESSPP